MNKKSTPDHDAPVSSAEFTGLWRSAYPTISYDNLSKFLISQQAKEQSKRFIKHHNYPLIERKISARAGYIFNQAVHLVENYHCNSIISLACGYSMLGFLIKQQVQRPIDIVNTDLLSILESRQSRYQQLPLSDSEQSSLHHIHHIEFDIEKAYLDNTTLTTFFKKFQRPIIILEGITYFLNPQTRDWLITQLKDWKDACIILEYWPENSLEISKKLKDSFEADLHKDFKEKLKSFMTDQMIDELKSSYDWTDIGIGEAELILSTQAAENNRLIDQNDYYPIRIFTGVPHHIIQNQ